MDMILLVRKQTALEPFLQQILILLQICFIKQIEGVMCSQMYVSVMRLLQNINNRL